MTKYFPWRFFWKLAGSIFSVVSVFLLLFFMVGRLQPNISRVTLILELFAMVFLSFGVSLGVAYRFAIPMRKVVLKAMRLANKRLFFQMNGPEIDKDVLFKQENEEFLELDQYLEQIRAKLKKRSEQMAHGYEESKTLMSSIEDAVVSVDKESKILFFNSAFASKFVPRHFLQDREATKFSLAQIFQDSEIIQLFENAANTGKGGKIQRSVATRMDTAERIFSLSVSPLRDKKTDEIFEVMGIFHDISEIRWAEKIRTEFVENASHELRSPLTAVVGYLDLIKNDVTHGDSTRVLDHLQIVNKSVSRLNALVDDLLMLSKLEHGARLNTELFEPRAMTEEVFQKLAPLAKTKQVRLEVECLGLEVIQADATKVEQVLSNLVGNAIKYNRDQGSVHVSWIKDPEGYLLVVKDDGPGIAKIHQARLFERFYRVDRARSRDVGGTGLGLAIVKHIMNIHGGTVVVHSDVGEGAEFICFFPENSVYGVK